MSATVAAAMLAPVFISGAHGATSMTPSKSTSTSTPEMYFSTNASAHLDETYWPAWKALFLEEGTDAAYPMPAGADTPDLLSALSGVKGVAVNTDPGTTVTEGQGYAMFVAGMRGDVDTLKQLVVAWQANGQGVAGVPACGGCGVNDDSHLDATDICDGTVAIPDGVLCKTVDGAYMPGWDMPYSNFGVGSMGSATDGDEDAVTGIIYLAEATGDEEIREYAVKSITAFVLEDLGYANATLNSRPVPHTGDIPESQQTMYLWRGGSCWGGYDTSSPGTNGANRNLCINPAYFSPGQWRLFRDYLKAHSKYVPRGFTAEELGTVLDSAIVWGYNTLNRISCDNGLVSNWWTLPDQGWPWDGSLSCANSGTSAGAYYSDASRIPWRVALDYLWYPEETAQTPLYNDKGKLSSTPFGAVEYSNRWATSWLSLIADSQPAGAYPPFADGVQKLRNDQVLPLLSDLATCDACPDGFMASPWNGWGAYPVVTAFQVPMPGVDASTMQEWVDFMDELAFAGCTHAQYFDLGQEVIVSSMLSGIAVSPLA